MNIPRNPERRSAARVQRGMTLLEIMIVLAIIALVMGFLIGPRVLRSFSKSEEEVARAVAKQFAYQAYTEFKADMRKPCPGSLDELLEYMDKKDTNDPWGNPYEMYCGDKMPKGTPHRFGVRSNGPDGQPNTSDDIKSWEKKPKD